MPTAIGHSVFGYGLYRLPARWEKLQLSRKALLLFALILPCVPDLDVISFRWVPYQHFLGHRGYFHSIGFFVPLSIVLAGILHWKRPKPRSWRPSLLCATYFFILMFSHGVLDTFTDGGKGVMLFYPFSEKRYFAPFRPIPVSSIPGFRLIAPDPDPAGQVSGPERLLNKKSRRFTRAIYFLLPFKGWNAYLLAVILTEFVLLIPPLLLLHLLFASARASFWSRRSNALSGRTNTILQIAGVALSSILLAASYLKMNAPNPGIVETSLRDPNYLSTRIIKIYRPDKTTCSAIFLHGWRCNKKMWLLLARYLAQSGTVCYLIDVPGHGESTILFDKNWIGNMVWSVRALIEREHINLDRTAFVGHSMGGQFIMNPKVIATIPVGSNISLEGWELATIPLFPYYQDPNLARPRNLVEAESKDLRWIKKQEILVQLAASLERYDNMRNLYGSPENFNAIGLARLPDDVGHTTLTWNKKAFSVTRQWLNFSFRTDSETNPEYSSFWLQTGILSSFMFFLFLTHFVSQKTASFGQPYLGYGIVAAAPKWVLSTVMILALAVFTGYYYEKLNVHTLGILHIPDASPWIFYMVVCSILLLATNSKLVELHSWKRVFFSLCVSFILFILLYYSAGKFHDRHLFGLEIPYHRLGRFLLIAAVLTPYFLIEEAFFRRMQSQEIQNWPSIFLTVVLPLCFRSVQLYLLFFRYDRMLRLTLLFIGITLVTQFASAFIYRYYRNSVVTGFFNSMVFSWIITVSFPISLLI